MVNPEFIETPKTPLFDFPFFVVIIIAPLAARAPYKAAAVAFQNIYRFYILWIYF
jgi:hypothetical protein